MWWDVFAWVGIAAAIAAVILCVAILIASIYDATLKADRALRWMDDRCERWRHDKLADRVAALERFNAGGGPPGVAG